MKNSSTNRKFFYTCFIIMLAWSYSIQAQTAAQLEAQRVVLPNGWKLSPAGKQLPAGDLPLNIVISPSKKLAAITNNGQSDQMIQLVDLVNDTVCDTIIIGKSWLGLAFTADGKSLYASGGNDNIIIRYSVINNKLHPADTIILGKKWPVKISPAGIALDERGGKIYIATKEDNSLYVADLKTRKVTGNYPLGGEGYTCLLSPDRKVVYVSCWGCDKVKIFDTALQKFTGEITVGDNPNDMCITKKGKYLFVANANDNSVSVIDTRQGRVIETLNSSLYPGSPSGSTTNSVALSGDEKSLYVANADNNCLAVFDISVPGSGKSRGFIPTAWYPTCVRVVNDQIIVSNGKGGTSHSNPYGPNPMERGNKVLHHANGTTTTIKEQYIGGLLRGTLSIIRQPDTEEMAVFSKAVYENTPYIKDKELESEGMAGNPVPMKVGDPSPIKHVFYIIKENRTYDQVLGDMPEGNGDPSLCLFGETVTPNHHAIAREFVLLDNFYVNGEVSADGHNWTMGAYATDYLEKNWPTSYGSRGGSYPGEGEREIANNKDGFLWDACKRMNVSYRTYGEFIGDNGPNIPVLKGHYYSPFGVWDMTVRDTVRMRRWQHDFDSLMAVNAVPALNTVRIFNDHTEGLSLGKPTPRAHVADNDLAIGMFIDYLSHSPLWKESLVVIVEDDAQNGPDHVDAHRSIAFVAGGYVKKNFVDHTVYTTTSLLRTIELILGLPPMTQYDAAATPLWRCFNNTPDHEAFNVKPCNIDLNEKNGTTSIWQKKSEKFDLSKEDRVNDAEFNEVIWKAVRGLDAVCPPAVHAAFFMQSETEDDD